MDPDDHGLLGFSQGGAFVGFSLFARPGAFSKYICGSPGMYAGNFRIFELEQEYAAKHDDLPATVFFGAGEDELVEPLISAFGCVSSMAKMVETLVTRGYPSLRLTAKVFSGESHGTMLGPLVNWGVRAVWGDEIAGRNFYTALRDSGKTPLD
jgi:predicted alpha/beta superfamily hydrolase